MFELSGTSTEREDQWSPDTAWFNPDWCLPGTNICRMERVNTLLGQYSPPVVNNANTHLFILHVNAEAASDVQITQRRIKSLCTEFCDTGLQGWEAWSEPNSIINGYNMLFPFFL